MLVSTADASQSASRPISNFPVYKVIALAWHATLSAEAGMNPRTG